MNASSVADCLDWRISKEEKHRLNESTYQRSYKANYINQCSNEFSKNCERVVETSTQKCNYIKETCAKPKVMNPNEIQNFYLNNTCREAYDNACEPKLKSSTTFLMNKKEENVCNKSPRNSSSNANLSKQNSCTNQYRLKKLEPGICSYTPKTSNNERRNAQGNSLQRNMNFISNSRTCIAPKPPNESKKLKRDPCEVRQISAETKSKNIANNMQKSPEEEFRKVQVTEERSDPRDTKPICDMKPMQHDRDSEFRFRKFKEEKHFNEINNSPKINIFGTKYNNCVEEGENMKRHCRIKHKKCRDQLKRNLSLTIIRECIPYSRNELLITKKFCSKCKKSDLHDLQCRLGKYIFELL